MQIIENRLVGENSFEDAVLRKLVEDKLCEFGNFDDLESLEVGDPGETGTMFAEAEWRDGSLDCEVWIGAEWYCEDPHCEDPDCEDFCLAFKWSTPEREGFWYDLDDIIERDEQEGTASSAALSGGLRLITP